MLGIGCVVITAKEICLPGRNEAADGNSIEISASPERFNATAITNLIHVSSSDLSSPTSARLVQGSLSFSCMQ